MSDFKETLVSLGETFLKFCKNPNRETESHFMMMLSALECCFPEDPLSIYDDDGSIVRIEVFGEDLTEAILHFKAMKEKAEKGIAMREDGYIVMDSKEELTEEQLKWFDKQIHQGCSLGETMRRQREFMKWLKEKEEDKEK